jgi:uncharacterized protein YndB with AHSA1/START domain
MVERSVWLPVSCQELWEAVTTREGLSEWFGGVAVELEPWPGGRVVMDEGGILRRGLVQVVEPPRRFVFRWLPIEEGPDGVTRWIPGTTVELLLEETPDGTRLTVQETAFPMQRREARMMVAR